MALSSLKIVLIYPAEDEFSNSSLANILLRKNVLKLAVYVLYRLGDFIVFL